MGSTIHGTANIMNINMLTFIYLVPKSHKDCSMAQMDTHAHNGLHYRRGALSLGNLPLSYIKQLTSMLLVPYGNLI